MHMALSIMTVLCFMIMLMNMCFVVSMVMGFLFQNHIKVTGIDPAFFRPPDRYFIPVQRQGLKSCPEGLLSRTQIQECAHCHIPADTGVTFQI